MANNDLKSFVKIVDVLLNEYASTDTDTQQKLYELLSFLVNIQK